MPQKHQNTHIHFIGIGGIGMSALAQFLKKEGAEVTGSDLSRSEITDALKKAGIRVAIGSHHASAIPQNTRTVVRSAAIPESNPEYREAKARGLSIKTYAEALGPITRRYKTIAIAGAHGKSTTTGMVTAILLQAGRDPSVIIGTKTKELGDKNFRHGESDLLVVEADEYRASFLNYTPSIAVITNIDREHLDFYKNIRAIKAAFLNFLKNTRPKGIVILNAGNAYLKEVARSLKKARPDLRIEWYEHRNSKRKLFNLNIPGAHNQENALAAKATAHALGISKAAIKKGLENYRGSWRRFEIVGKTHGATLIADYAHHPTEINATLEGARERFPQKNIICVFQPHHQERTRDLFKEFAHAFKAADQTLLLDIYEVAGRERHQGTRVHSRDLAQAIQKTGSSAEYISSEKMLRQKLAALANPATVIILMGAGSIWEITKRLAKAGKN